MMWRGLREKLINGGGMEKVSKTKTIANSWGEGGDREITNPK